MVKKIKTFKAEKEILEEFFKNRKLKIKNKKSYPLCHSVLRNQIKNTEVLAIMVKLKIHKN